MPEIKLIDTKPGDRLAKLVISAPREPWFASSCGSAWSGLPVNSILEVIRSDDIPEYGGTVVQLKGSGNRIVLIPQSWLTSQHFRVVPKISGQQELKFIAPPIRR